MGKLQIIRFENDRFQIANLQIGNNIIGRNDITGFSKEQFIKQAVTINLSPSGDITLTPYQISPCYIKSSGSSRWHLLKLGTSVPIKPGDICSLLSNKCWFKIITMSETTEKDNHLLKRKCADELTFEPLDKKICFDAPQKSIVLHDIGSSKSQNSKDSSKPTVVEIPVSNKGSSIDASTFSKDIDTSLPENNQTIPSQISEVQNPDLSNGVKENSNIQEKEEKKVEANIKQELVMSFSANDESNTLVQQDMQETTSLSTPERNEPNISNIEQVQIKRNKCVYKDKCYRKNPDHKVQFSHPGDPDFEEVDERPECPYGIKCYRTNPQHKAEFQHSTMRQRCVPPRVQYVPPVELLLEDESSDESVDESDYEPSDCDHDGVSTEEEMENFSHDSDYDFYDSDESNSDPKDSNSETN
ncbi:PREDICTED: aprataxin and PNK-like factor [Polistes canadensis]|uniref:aprataxin and PNK-like factor n=1 Tax=Polistes canadensis TaxID=91411 RepID=UPI000718C589|nr:PREDICTED: aprataxin and PNK-like factor [Polistes canadensis]